MDNQDKIREFCGILEESQETPSLPLYISIDKDVLLESEGKTNWDQGNVRVEQILKFTENYIKGRRLIGTDVCGEDPENDNDEEQVICRETSEKIGSVFLA